MSVRSRIADRPVSAVKAFGGSEPPAMAAAAEDVSRMGMTHPFAPGEPIGPYDGYSRTPRSRDYGTGYNIATRPRIHEAVSFDTLKSLIRSYDVARICIRHRIASIRSLDWKLIAADGHDGDVSDAIPAGLAALKRPDRKTLFRPWLAKYLNDVLSYDAGTLYRMRNRAGRAIGLKVIDGTSVAPLLDYWGDSPDAPAEAYVQYVNGLPWNWLTRDDLIYEPYDPQPDSIYGRAPIEDVLLNANTDIRFQVYFLQRFTEGNLPAAFASAPEGWSPQQIEQFQEFWDSFMLGDQSRKSQIRWIPGGSSFAWSDEKEFTDTFSLFLMRKTCAAFAVVPSDIGFTEDVNRSSGESQADVQHKVGDLPLMEHVEGILSAFLAEDLGLPLQFQFDRGEEQADQLAVAQSDDYYIKTGVVGVSEIREMRFGLAEPDGIPVPRYIFSNRAGPIPLSSLVDVAGPVDRASGAPVPGAPLPHNEFEPVEGVVPVPPPAAPALAERIYGPSAIPPPPPAAPVAKEGEGAPSAGITSGTGVYGYDGPGDDDEPPVQSAGEVTVAVDPERAAVAKEMAAFRRFEKARRRSGSWRDFAFGAVPAVRGHRLNDAGRLAVRKAAGEIAVAGLAVLAADTGRVLMLQRALSGDDPAAGTWEFPGGHVEGAETPLQGAWREWAEETGCIPPPGRETGTWDSSNGVYRGIVWTVDAESCVPVRTGAVVANPDDPDGDMAEAIAWMDPEQLPGNPSLRPELLADIGAVLAALGCAPAADCCGAECCADGCCDGTGECECAPADVAKAGASTRPEARKALPWPGWKLDGPAVAHWAPLITAAASEALSRSRLARAAAAYLAAHPSQDGSGEGKRARNEAALAWLTAWMAAQGITLSLAPLAAGIVTDAYLIGVVSAAAMTAGKPADTGGWEPGETSTARDRIEALGAAAALAAVLASGGDDAGDAIAGGYLGALARELAGADGDGDAAALGDVLAGVLADGDLAGLLVYTQIEIFTGAAATAHYLASGVAWGRWMAHAESCQVCRDNEAQGPVRIGQPYQSGHADVPAHPSCGCAVVPADAP